ncbi:DUF992 domain-containing protein [uncultured Tateyamaria sp.]|uniref:DUF992 domain-containing protein n=1 Tax=uncultured Tateyamaria sp. TaxID=455651 RepID=UPI0026325826|nr:DUF992 domain-containing protein [uncultured Tateyamaria sp.]
MTSNLKLIALAAASVVAPMAASAGGVATGVLTCHQSNEANFVVYSSAKYDCDFTSASGRTDRFTGTIRKVGVDLSTSNEQTLVWYVFAPQSGVKEGALEGGYIGASADASVGAGAGVHALIGGLDRSFTLQPVSVSGEIGVGAAVGVETLRLRHKG